MLFQFGVVKLALILHKLAGYSQHHPVGHFVVTTGLRKYMILMDSLLFTILREIKTGNCQLELPLR